MLPFYSDYIWREGKPVGVGKDEAAEVLYRIVADPYRKWITVEAYHGKKFDRIVYDSRFLDFCKLKPADQAAWRKEQIDDTSAWIFNEDDRLILRESYDANRGEVKIFSPYNTLVCLYHMPEGPEGAVELYDSNQHIVMRRVGEKWDMTPKVMSL